VSSLELVRVKVMARARVRIRTRFRVRFAIGAKLTVNPPFCISDKQTVVFFTKALIIVL